MSLDAWGQDEGADDGRARRLLGSYAIAALVVAGLLILGAVFGGKIKQQVLQEEIEVKFVAPEKQPEPPPPPPPAPPPPKVKAATQGPPPRLGAKVDAPPIEIPKEKPREDDPWNAVAEVPFGEGDPNGCVGCTGKRGGGGAITPAPSATPAPAPPRPYQIAEVTTPPVAITKNLPAYPDDARKQGIDMVVVVKFIVTETGEVEGIRIVTGHPTLDQAVIDAVKSWRFTPGTLDGRPVRVSRKMKFPFHLKTQT